jgi:hypothetical protein
MNKTSVALVALPWQPFDHLSIQLGTLTASLRKVGRDVTAFHYYRDFVEYLSKNSWSELHQNSRGEAVFAALLFSDRQSQIKNQIGEMIGDLSFEKIIGIADQYLADIINHQDWGRYVLIGFSVSHEQLMASLELAKRLKHFFPEISIAFGGSLINKSTATGLLELFPQIDFAVFGEGEKTLIELVEALSMEGNKPLEDVNGIVFRKNKKILVIRSDLYCTILMNFLTLILLTT